MHRECIAYVIGYQRRRKMYEDARDDILEGSKAPDGMPRSPDFGRPAEEKAARLAALETWPEVKKMRAVEYAMERVGRGIENPETVKRLTRAIMLNCKGQYAYAQKRLLVPGVSEATFWRRKAAFLQDIAEFSGLLE